MKRVVPLILVALVATACQEAGPTTSPSGRDEIVIASDLPTYAVRFPALSLQQAIQLAIHQNPYIGGYRLVYRPLDDTLAATWSPPKGVQNLKKMIADASVLGMIGPVNSVVAFEEIPVANAAGLVMLNPSNTVACLTLAAPSCGTQPAALRPSGLNNYFRIAAPDSWQGRAMARYAAGSLQVRRVAAFADDPYDAMAIDSFEVELSRLGGTLVHREDHLTPGTSNFTDFLGKAKARGAQAIYAATGADDACAASAEIKRSFPDGAQFLTIDAPLLSDCIAAAPNNADGMFATFPGVDPAHSTDAAVKKVLEAYAKAYPKPPGIEPYTLEAYDCARILIDAIKRAIVANGGSFPTRRQVRDAVARSQYTGATGTYSFDANGDAIGPPMSLYRVQNGQLVYLGQIDASSKQS